MSGLHLGGEHGREAEDRQVSWMCAGLLSRWWQVGEATADTGLGSKYLYGKAKLLLISGAD